ncbi:MAG: hypothetical protein ACJAS3_003476 [Roseivirga sp.]|jgi:hypothetical protein
MSSMFGISLEWAFYTDDGYYTLFVNRIADRLRPYRADMLWFCHSIGLHPLFKYYTPLGQLKRNK